MSAGDQNTSANNTEAFSSSKTQLIVGEKKYILRILKMHGSTLLFLSNQVPECLDELAVAMPMPGEKKEVISSVVLGDHDRLNSYRLAEKLSKRFDRTFVVSFNADVDRLTESKLEENLIAYIRNHKEQFA